MKIERQSKHSDSQIKDNNKIPELMSSNSILGTDTIIFSPLAEILANQMKELGGNGKFSMQQ